MKFQFDIYKNFTVHETQQQLHHLLLVVSLCRNRAAVRIAILDVVFCQPTIRYLYAISNQESMFSPFNRHKLR